MDFASMLLKCSLGDVKGIWPVKDLCFNAKGMLITGGLASQTGSEWVSTVFS